MITKLSEIYVCKEKVNVYLPSLKMKVPDHVYIYMYMSHVNNNNNNKVQPIRVKMIRIAAIRVNVCLILLSNGSNVGIGHTCNTMRVYHDNIITCATADSFCSLFPYPLHNPRSHTCAYVTHMTVNGPGVTSRKVRYGSRDCQDHTKK
jgi:hypothetical protein